MRVVALVPAKDRGDSVVAAVSALVAADQVARVVVIDDGSTDDTAAAAAGAGATVVRLPANVGKGGAIAAGIAAAPDADVYLLVDADVGASASGALALVPPVVEGRADMAIGVLPPAGRRGGLGRVRRLAATGIRRACGFDAAAPLSGQRAVRGALLRSLAPAPRFGLETAMTIDAVRAGARVVELPVAMDHRHTGRGAGGFRHRAGQGLDIVRALWPRVTTEGQRISAIVAAAVLIAMAGFWTSAHWEAPSRPLVAAGAVTRVVLLGLPGLSWDDIDRGRVPNFVALSERGALGAMTVRTISTNASPLEAYASLGAGTRVKATDSSDIAMITRQNRGQHLASQPGALGDALHRASVTTAASGDALAALADRSGRVDGSPSAEVRAIDLGSPPPAADAELGRIAASIPPDTLVIAFAPTPPGRDWHLGPVAVTGPGVPRGRLMSPSTRRAGLVTLTDVGPTVMAALGRATPSGMIGHAMRVHPERAPSFAASHELDRGAALRDHVNGPVTLTYVIFQCVIYLLTLAAFAWRGGVGRVGPALRLVVLLIAAFPLATFLLRVVPNMAGLGDVGGVAAILAIDLVLIALATRARRRPLAPLSWVLGATAWVIMIDVATGARLQTNSIMGYSPTTSSRFFGVGNAAFAILASTAVLAAGLHLVHAPRRKEALVAVAAFFAIVVLTDGAPTIGDDVGGILTLVPVLGLTLIALSGRKLRWRAVALAAAATVAIVALAAGVDLLRAPESRTHLGRFVADLFDGGSSPGRTTIARKMATNARVLTSSVWTMIIVVIAAFSLGLLAMRRRFNDLLPPDSPHRVVVTAAFAVGILGSLVNDSGVVVTALVFVFVGPYLTLLALATGGSEAHEVVDP
ncbi:MAG: hypothetical protein JWO37_1618 [Acidimicrobiales bacterium]|nr:hypothetical protein [Acidimicrobiales bacterium]